MTTGQRIGARLAELGMNKAELARALGESAQRIGQYVNDKRTPDPEMLARIAAKLGVYRCRPSGIRPKQPPPAT